MLADGEATLLLTDLPSQGLVFEIPELQLVKDAPDLDPQRRFLVMAIESIGDLHHTHTGEVELSQYREHEIFVASKTGKIVDENHLKLSALRRTE